MHIRIALFFIYMAISLPLCVVYILVIGLLAVRSEFDSSFYTFFVFTGIVDLILFTLNIFCYYLPFIPGVSQFYVKFQDEPWNSEWRPEYSWMISVANTLMYYMASIQDVTNLLVSLNRFLALLYPFLFKKIFTRAFTLVLIPLAMIISFTSCFITIAAPGFFVDITDENGTEKIYMMHAESQVHFPTINRSTLISSHIFACNGLCFLIYCIIAVQIFRAKAVNSGEVRLFFLGFLILLTNAPSIIYQIYWSIYKGDGSSTVFMLLPWVIMVKTLAPPLLLLMTNTGMRREIRLFLPLSMGGSVKESSARDATII